MNGSVHRQETGKPDPTIVKFERYAFDLSRFSGGRTVQNFGVRERYLWDLASPDPADPVYKQFAPQFRTEFHDRLVAPIYPIAFTVICFAILGAPRTSRQSRETSIIMAIVAARRAADDRICLQRLRRAVGGRDLRALCLAGDRARGRAFSRSRAAASSSRRRS